MVRINEKKIMNLENEFNYTFDPSIEPLLQEQTNRYVITRTYDDLYAQYNKHQNLFWTVHEIQLNKDVDDWNNLDENAQKFLSHVLAFFAASDG